MPTDTEAARFTFAATTANGIPLWFVWDPDTRTVRVYDRRFDSRYTHVPRWAKYGQPCGEFAPESFTTDATDTLIGWQDNREWDIDARLVRLVAAFLKVSGFTEEN
jgi:hypothetical protein